MRDAKLSFRKEKKGFLEKEVIERKLVEEPGKELKPLKKSSTPPVEEEAAFSTEKRDGSVFHRRVFLFHVLCGKKISVLN